MTSPTTPSSPSRRWWPTTADVRCASRPWAARRGPYAQRSTSRSAPTKVIAFANQKGGVGKTTSALCVAAAMQELGRRVLVVDLDPQACMTFSLGYDPDVTEPSLHDVVVGRVTLTDTVLDASEVDLAPANIDLAGAEVTLLSRTGREYLLRGELADLEDRYDVAVLDCAPSLGVLTINGLTAADEVVIPVQCETLAHRGVAQLLETVHDVRRLTNRSLVVRGVVATMFDGRTNHSKEVLRDLIARYELDLVGAPVRKSIRFAEAPTNGASVITAGLDVPGAAAYRIIARELLDEPVTPALLEAARWGDAQRDALLGIAEDDTDAADETTSSVADAVTTPRQAAVSSLTTPAAAAPDWDDPGDAEAAGDDGGDDDALDVVDLDEQRRGRRGRRERVRG